MRYEMGHLIPLAIGGSNVAANLWPQPWPEAEKKDVLEIKMKGDSLTYRTGDGRLTYAAPDMPNRLQFVAFDVGL